MMSFWLVLAAWLCSGVLGAAPAAEKPAAIAAHAELLTVALLPGDVRARPGATALAWVMVTNVSAGAITITAVELISESGTISLFGPTLPWTLPHGGALPIKLRFKPIASGASPATLQLHVGSDTHTFPVSAVGDPDLPLGMNNEVGELAIGDGDVAVGVVAAPAVSTQAKAPVEVEVWPPVLEAPVGGVALAIVSLRNPGFAPITLRRVALLDGTDVSRLPRSQFPFALRAGGSVSFYLYFYPTVAESSWLVVRVLSDLGTTEARVEAHGIAPPADAAQRAGNQEQAVIDDVIERNLARIQYCYRRELDAHPGLAGRVAVHFSIAPDGTVIAAETASTTMNNASVETCLNEVFLRLVFPGAAGEGVLSVSHPFAFGP